MTAGRALDKVSHPKRKALPHGIPEWVDAGTVFFLTVCCQSRGTNQLCHATTAAHIFEAAEFRQRSHRWYMRYLLLMPDHLHCLVSFPQNETMRKVVANFKEMTSKVAGIVWQRDFFDHRLRSAESFDEKAEYIRMNPVRKGLVMHPDEWSWAWRVSSGGPSGPALPRS